MSGDVRFYVGKNTNFENKVWDLPDGSFRFFLPDGREVLTISPEGEFSVFGRVVESDRDVYDTFKIFLECARIESEKTNQVLRGEA